MVGKINERNKNLAFALRELISDDGNTVYQHTEMGKFLILYYRLEKKFS